MSGEPPGTQRRCEVLVVGGGPAGSSVAWSLGRGGVDVLLVDRASFPRDKVCAGWITPAVARALALDLEDYGRGRVLQPIHGFRIGMIGGRAIATRRNERPLSFGIRRCEFDDYLLARAGARLRLGTPLSGLRREGRDWVADGGIRARLVVGAGGHFCPVARALGAGAAGRERAVLAQEVEFRMTPAQERACPVDPEVPELYFCRDLAGYGWIFRKGPFLNVGLGREDPHGLAAHVERLRERLIAAGRLPPDMPRRARGHAYLLYPRAARAPCGDGFLLVGDAAGLAYAESGEGIRPAVESGLLAAETIVTARGDYRGERLAGYARRLAERFGRRGRRLTVPLPPGLKRGAAARLLAAEWFARRVVVDRWFLRTHSPPLDVQSSRKQTSRQFPNGSSKNTA